MANDQHGASPRVTYMNLELEAAGIRGRSQSDPNTPMLTGSAPHSTVAAMIGSNGKMRSKRSFTEQSEDRRQNSGSAPWLDDTSHTPLVTSSKDPRELSAFVKEAIEEETENLEFGRDCYALILLSGRVSILIPMLAVSFSQCGILWIIGWSSPEYIFEGGQWIQPISDYWSVNAMKALSLLLTLLRITAEFRDATKIFRVVTHYPRVPMQRSHRLLGGCAFVLQYCAATVVFFMAIHLILATTTALATIGKLWVVFMLVDFDNFLCNFILYVFNLEGAFKWTVPLRRAVGRRHSRSWICFYWVPVSLALACVTASFYWNVCPLTCLRYGVVRNDDPILMLTSNLGIPGGCCPPQVTWDTNSARQHLPVNVSVPCLSPATFRPGARAPRIHYVVVPDARTDPSSLQVLEGRAGDGNSALLHGALDAKPLQMRWWLTVHGFAPEVYDRMLSKGAGGLELYRSDFPYVGEWTIPHFPWSKRARVFAVAVNMNTGALSPKPVQSTLIIRRLCTPHCEECTHVGACSKCQMGYVLASHGQACLPCALGCSVCEAAGSRKCDPGGCAAGYGYSTSVCMPCAGTRCLSCDVVANATAYVPSLRGSDVSQTLASWGTKPRETELPCLRCEVGFGLPVANSSTHGCKQCQVANCADCPGVDYCGSCTPGFKLVRPEGNESAPGTCRACADHCFRCDLLGPGRCDPEQCALGFSLTPAGLCETCSGHCLNCTEAGPGKCNAGQCKLGYGLQGDTECTPCNVDNCEVCDAGRKQCESCLQGYGLTPEKSCESCAANCKRCTRAGACAECSHGFGLEEGRCLACADQCEQCDIVGPGQCDKNRCSPGWTDSNSTEAGNTCIPIITADADQATSEANPHATWVPALAKSTPDGFVRL